MRPYYLTHNGITLTLKDWAARLGLPRTTLEVRKGKGWTDQQIIEGSGRNRGERTLEGEARRKAAITKHGHAPENNNSKEYRVWAAMIRRCNNKNTKHYHRYGGRGIRCCKWFSDFIGFIHDMGPRPSSKYSIDRKDNDANYSCGHCEECSVNGWVANCRWATRKEQSSNNSRNVRVEYQGVAMIATDAARLIGIDPSTLLKLIKKGESPDYVAAKRKLKQIKRVQESPLAE